MKDFVTARTVDGIRLPIIDVTNPRFSIPDSDEDVAALRRTCEAEDARRADQTGFLHRLMFRVLAMRSRILRSLYQDSDYLDGISTYVLKLGADNLPPPFNSSVDKALAKSAHAAAVGLRLQQCAKLLAEDLRGQMARSPGTRVHLINIAGGPAMDSLNALLILAKEALELLARKIIIEVLDIEKGGPTFGARALCALSKEGAPLDGFDISFKHKVYDWNDTSLLQSIVQQAAMKGEIVAASSEGGLFEYGNDETIIKNLKALSGHPIVGSVTNGDELRRRTLAKSRFKIFPRTLEEFERVAAVGGYRIRRAEPGPISCQVLLEAAG